MRLGQATLGLAAGMRDPGSEVQVRDTCFGAGGQDPGYGWLLRDCTAPNSCGFRLQAEERANGRPLFLFSAGRFSG
jgi:hypothetical protein